MTELNIVTLGASKLANGVPTVQAASPLTDATEDVEQSGQIEMLSQLGVYAMPAESDATGHVDAIICENIGGANAVCVGAIDRRNAAIYGNLKPGDTVLCATGPRAVSQVMCKADKRQVVLATKGSDQKQILFTLDGKNDVATWAAFGLIVELSKDNGISITDGGAGIRIHNGTLQLLGKLVINQGANQAMAIALCPKTGSPGGPASVPLLPLLGCSV